MRFYILLCALIVSVLCEPEGYVYKEPAPVIEKQGLQSVLPPCRHANGYNFDGGASALIQSQTQGKILNQNHQHLAAHSLEAAASAYNSQSHLTTSNQIGLGVGNKGGLGAYPGGLGAFSSSPSYVQTTVPKPPVNYIPLSQGPTLPLQGQAQTFTTSQNQNHGYHQTLSTQNFKQSNPVHVPAVFPLPPRPGSPLQLSLSRPQQHTSQYVGNHHHAAQSFSGQSSQFGGLTSAGQFGGPPKPLHFGGQPSATNIGAQQVNYVQPALSSNFESHFGSSNFLGQQSNAGLGTFSLSGHGDQGLNGQLGQVIRETVANTHLDPAADKHIYVHIPPEELENEAEASALPAQFIAPAKKHYKIVFIKAPTHQAPKYNQLPAAPQVEEKTLIYVLVKKPEQPSLEALQQLQQTEYKSSKPEVYFIKYKTQKEGELAQNTAYAQSGSAVASDQIEFTTSNPVDQIDIRSGGGVGDNTKHELYGVPLQ